MLDTDRTNHDIGKGHEDTGGDEQFASTDSVDKEEGHDHT